MAGLFITFEGSEGCGKSTQMETLAKRLESLGHPVVLTREPGGTPLGEQIRHLLKFAVEGFGMVPEAELLLFCASRAQHVREKILPALAADKIVLSDRFHDSSTVYQGIARGLPLDLLEAVHRFTLGALKPRLTLVLDMDSRKAHERALRRVRLAGAVKDRLEAEAPEFYQIVRQGYLELAQKEPERIRVISADQPEQQVAEAIWKEVENVLLDR